MKRLVCMLLFAFVAAACTAQTVTDDGEFDFRLQADGGITNFRPWQVNAALFNHRGFDQLRTFGFTFGLSDEGYNEPDDDYWGYDMAVSMHWFMAEEQVALFSDSSRVAYRVKGWEMMTDAIGLNLIKNKHVDFLAGVGAYWGNMKLRATNLAGYTETKKYANPFVAPMFRTELRFNFWLLSAGARFSYRYDLTNGKWKRKSENLDPLPEYKFREMQFMCYIGFHFPTKWDE